MGRFRFILTAALLIIAALPVGLYANEEVDYVTGNTSYRLPVPKAYNVARVINNIGGFAGENNFLRTPQDLFIDDADNLYIVDTGFNRIIKIETEGFTTVRVYRGPDGIPFNTPTGIFVDSDGSIYVADTGNNRIVHMSAEGELIRTFVNPESSVTDAAPFAPTKLVVSPTGYIYVLRGENIMAIDGNNGFRGLYGQTNIGFSLNEAITRMFASERQQLFMTRRLASSYLNLTLGSDGMIYATSMDRVEGEVKKLNSVGNNIYRKYRVIGNSFTNTITDFINRNILRSVVAGRSFRFGEYFDMEDNYKEPIFADIAVDNMGIVSILEEGGMIYQYDQEGQMLVAFGGRGERVGTFSRPTSIAADSRGRLYVLDGANNNVHVFVPTEFITLVHQAVTEYSLGNYDASYALWRQVLEIHENYELAHAGIAKTYYKQGRWRESMDESKLVRNRDIYTSSFEEYKYDVLRANFVLVVFITIGIIIAAVVFMTVTTRGSKKAYWNFITHKTMGVWEGIKVSYNVLWHPVDTLEAVRFNRATINLKVPLILMVTAYVVRIAYIYVVHYPLASIELEDANIVFEAFKLFIIPLTWVPAAFAVSSISDGESKFREIFFAAALALFPFIFINTPLMLVSNIMSKSQQSWYGTFSFIVYLWMFIIFFLSMKILNDYTFGKTIKMMVGTAFMMFVIWLIAGLFYVLLARFLQFAFGVIMEFRLSVF